VVGSLLQVSVAAGAQRRLHYQMDFLVTLGQLVVFLGICFACFLAHNL